jgi:selenide, water dikinase
MHAVRQPVLKDVVLVGAGHAHVAVLRMFGMTPLPGVRFTLITREVHSPYSGMLPGLIAGHYSFDQAHIDTAPLARFAGARLYQDESIGLDLANRRVICRNRPPVPYDLVSLDIGSIPNTARVSGADENAIPVKPIDGFLARFLAMKERVLARKRGSRIAVVGAGAGGVELMLSVAYRLRREARDAGLQGKDLNFVLVSAGADVLPTFPAGFRTELREILNQRGISVITGAAVTQVEARRLVLDDGRSVEADEVLWTTKAKPASWLGESGLSLDQEGFVKVAPTLRAVGRDDVFAAGDVISFAQRELPKSGVYAVRAGPVLAENIRRVLTGRRPQPFRPQREAMYLVSTGDTYAVGTRNGLVFKGAWVWRWKDWIDRRFMRRFNQLPEMASSYADAADGRAGTKFLRASIEDVEALKEISALAMRCGGCGAKVGATVLSRALAMIEPAPRNDVIAGLDAPDDAALVDTGGEKLSVQTVDYFRAMVDDPFLFGQIAANHALGDIYAMGGEPQSALAIATVPFGLETKLETDLSAMLLGANKVLRAADCALVGGHTSEGAELALGFAVNGLVRRADALCKSGARPGDALILTKALGTGTILAADMRGKTRARWLMGAFAHMLQSNRGAAEILREHTPHAATDVTGFGLLGHLVEMVRASDVDVTLALDRIPVLAGASETIEMGIFSSLQPQNVRLRRAIRNLEPAAAHPLFPLLFDPQTAGGLLAAVPIESAQKCVDALHAAGYEDASIIAIVCERSSALEPVTIDLDGSIIAHVLAVPGPAAAGQIASAATRPLAEPVL